MILSLILSAISSPIFSIVSLFLCTSLLDSLAFIDDLLTLLKLITTIYIDVALSSLPFSLQVHPLPSICVSPQSQSPPQPTTPASWGMRNIISLSHKLSGRLAAVASTSSTVTTNVSVCASALDTTPSNSETVPNSTSTSCKVEMNPRS